MPGPRALTPPYPEQAVLVEIRGGWVGRKLLLVPSKTPRPLAAGVRE